MLQKGMVKPKIIQPYNIYYICISVQLGNNGLYRHYSPADRGEKVKVGYIRSFISHFLVSDLLWLTNMEKILLYSFLNFYVIQTWQLTLQQHWSNVQCPVGWYSQLLPQAHFGPLSARLLRLHFNAIYDLLTFDITDIESLSASTIPWPILAILRHNNICSVMTFLATNWHILAIFMA